MFQNDLLTDARMQARAQDINILIACEESQRETIAFRNLGFNAYSCDLQMCSGYAQYSDTRWADALPPAIAWRQRSRLQMG